MANIITAPESGIYFDGNTAGVADIPTLTGNASGVAIQYDGYAGIQINSSATGVNYQDRFSVEGANGRLFGVSDAVTGTVFSVNDAAGLPIIEVESTSGYDKITIGEYGSDALVISGTNSALFNVDVDITGGLDVTGDITMGGATVLTGISSSSVTDALGYTPVDPSTTGALVNDNDIANFITGISSSDVTDALGYTPVDPSTTGSLVNDNDIANFITGISSSDVTDALGYTPLESESQTLSSVLANGNTSSYGISVNQITGTALTIDTDTLFVDATNDRVGIGLTSPAYDLHVTGSLGVSKDSSVARLGNSRYIPIYADHPDGYAHARINGFEVGGTTNSTNEGYIKTADNSRKLFLDTNGWRFVSNSTEYARVTSDGKVGIGTTSPSQKLHVNGNIRQEGASYSLNIDGGSNINGSNHLDLAANASYLNLRSPNNSIFYRAGSDHVFRNGNGSATYATIKTNGVQAGNVGIGTTSPSYDLDVSGSGHFVNNLVVDGDITMGGATVLTGISSSSVTDALGYTPVDPSTTGSLVNDNDIANFITGISSSSVTDALGYTPVDPSTTGSLVNDNDIANFITGISSSDVTDALGYTPLSSETDDQTLDEVLTQGNTSSQNISVGAITGSALTIDTDTLFVDATNDKVGIGTTSPATRLEVLSNANEEGISIVDSSDNLKYKVRQYGGNTYSSFWNSSNVEQVRITSGGSSYFNGGNVGIGTTSPSTKLDVSGSVTATSLIKSGGTSSQFLKADGSVDSNTYLTAHPTISAASSSDNSGRTYIQDITLDSNGHVTAIATATETVTDTNTTYSAESNGGLVLNGTAFRVDADNMAAFSGSPTANSYLAIHEGGSGGFDPPKAKSISSIPLSAFDDDLTYAPLASPTFTGNISVSDGSASSPAIRFSSDTDTGIYRSGSNTINFSTGGIHRAYISSAGISSLTNVYSGTGGQFRNYAGTWKATTGTTAKGFEFINSVDGTALTISSTGNVDASGDISADGVITTGGTATAEVGSWLHVGRQWSFSGLPFFNKTTGSTAQRLDGGFMTDLNTGSASSRRAQAVFGAAFNDISGYSGQGTDYSRALGASVKAGFFINGQNSAKVIFAVGFASTSGVYADADPISNYGFGVEFRRGSGNVYEWRVFGHNGTSLSATSWSSSGITYGTDPRTIAIYSDGSGNITAYTAMYGDTNYTTITTTGGPTASSGTSTSTNMVGLRCNTNASGYVTGAYAKARASAVNFYAE